MSSSGLHGQGADEKWLKSKPANRNPLKITVNGQNQVKLYPEDDEPVNILNVKRGIVSTLMVPVMEEDKNDNMVIVPAINSGQSLRNERLNRGINKFHNVQIS